MNHRNNIVMNPSKELANRFREVMLDGLWVANTNWKDKLVNIYLEQANKKVGDLNTIALLTFHVHYYIHGVLQVFEGGNLDIRDKYSFDMAPLKSEDQWAALKGQLFSDSETLASRVEAFSDDQLNAVFVDPRYGTYRRNVDVLIEHSYYHLGQVSLIQKLI